MPFTLQSKIGGSGQVSDVAHQAVVLGAFHRRAFEEAAVFVDGEGFPPFARHAKKFVGGLELGRCVGCGEAVPRAGGLAAVAAIECVAHRLFCRFRQFATVLYGLVGKAEGGVEKGLTPTPLQRRGGNCICGLHWAADIGLTRAPHTKPPLSLGEGRG